MKPKKWKPGAKVSFHYHSQPDKRYVGRLVQRYASGCWKIDTDNISLPTTFGHEDTFRKPS